MDQKSTHNTAEEGKPVTGFRLSCNSCVLPEGPSRHDNV